MSMEKLINDELLNIYIRAKQFLISSSFIYTQVGARKQRIQDVLNVGIGEQICNPWFHYDIHLQFLD